MHPYPVESLNGGELLVEFYIINSYAIAPKINPPIKKIKGMIKTRIYVAVKT